MWYLPWFRNRVRILVKSRVLSLKLEQRTYQMVILKTKFSIIIILYPCLDGDSLRQHRGRVMCICIISHVVFTMAQERIQRDPGSNPGPG
jgi:hypothetical protein